MLKITQYPKDFDGRPLDLLAAVATDASGNNGAQFPQSVVGPDGVPVDKVGLVLLDKAGNIFSSAIEAVDRTALAAISANDDEPRYLAEAGREGMFVWQSGNLSGQLIANGAFGVDTSGWTALAANLSVVGGQMRVTKPGSSSASAYQAVATTLGTTYRISADLTTGTSGIQLQLRVGTTPGASDIASLGGAGTQSMLYVGTGNTIYISCTVPSAATNGTYADFDNVSMLFAGVASDPYQGIFVPPTSDPTGVSGAWVRKFSGPVHASWFGLADGASANAARLKSIETIFSPYAQHIVLPATPTGKLDFDAGVSFSLPHAIEGQGQGTDSKTATLLRFPYGCGHGFAFRSGGLSDPGAQRASLRNLRIDLFGTLLAGATANFATGSPNTIGAVSDPTNFANGRMVALEGSGKSLIVQDRTVAMTSGGNTATVADPLGTGSNPGVYVGQPVTVAGAGAAAADLVGFVGTWGPTTFTVVNAAGAALNASTTVSAAAYTITFPLFGEITAGGGTATLTITTPYQTQNVTAGVLRNMDCCVLASCTIDMANVELNGQGSTGILSAGGNCGLFLYGIGGEGTDADNSQFWNVKTGGNLGFAGVIAYGSDAQAMSFHGCNFAGPKISVLDGSLLGSSFHGCHWEFNVGIVCVLPNAVTTIHGGYMEAGTSYLAPASAQCSFYGTTSMINASGWQGISKASANFALPGFTSPGGTFSGDIIGGKSICSKGTGTARFCGDGTNYPTGTLTTGIAAYYNSGRDSGVIQATDGSVNKSLELVGSNIVVRPANVIAGTWSGTGLAIVNAVSASNLSGTNTGDQTAGSGITLAGGAFSTKFRNLFNSFADVQNTTTTETDIFTSTTAAGELAANGDRVEAQYSGTFVNSATATRQLRVKFAGTTIFDSGALTISTSGSWRIKATIIRVSATVVRYEIDLLADGVTLTSPVTVGELTGLTLSNTNILKLTGQAAGTGAATGDIVGKLSAVDKRAA